MLRLALVLPLAWTAACNAPRPVHFSSDPAGARIVVDGQDSGFVTPCQLDLPDKRQRQVDFVLPGFRTATRFLTLEDQPGLVYWSDGAVGYKTWDFPLWLNYWDFFHPDKSSFGEWPSRLYVRMQREADG